MGRKKEPDIREIVRGTHWRSAKVRSLGHVLLRLTNRELERAHDALLQIDATGDYTTKVGSVPEFNVFNAAKSLVKEIERAAEARGGVTAAEKRLVNAVRDLRAQEARDRARSSVA